MKPNCYNRPAFFPYLQVQTGWTEDGRRITAYLPDPMSRGCQQHGPLGEATLHPEKWDCEGCCWKPAHTDHFADAGNMVKETK